MSTNRRDGFSVTELLVVITIVVTLAAICYPTLAQARRAAGETRCISNLKQLFVAIELYREKWDGIPVGTPSQMGLPPGWWLLKSELGLDNFRCSGLSPTTCDPVHGSGFVAMFPPGVPGFHQEWADLDWKEYVMKYGDSAVLFFDLNHPLACPVTDYSTGRAIGLRLNGAVKFRTRFGDPSHPSRHWWHDKGGS